MPRSRKPEAFPKAFFELLEELAASGRKEVECKSESQAYGLRALLYNFLKGLRDGSEDFEGMRDKLLRMRKLAAATDDYVSEAARLEAADKELGVLVALASEVTIRVERNVLTVLPKGETGYAQLVSGALNRKPLDLGKAAEESAARLLEELGGKL